jgi:hypothetical protein
MLTKKQKNIKKWVKALRSGKYKQTKYNLQDKTGYCCLGVACDIFISKNKKNLRIDNTLGGVVLSQQKAAPTWLKNINGEYHNKFGLGLVTLNDSQNFTFDEIADCLEIVYIHKL